MSISNKQVALCFLVWNEASGCEVDLPKIDLSQFGEVFAIDGGSSDGTVSILEKFGIRVHKQKQPSLNAAYWEAAEACSLDYLIIFFPKGTLDTSILYKFAQSFEAGNELVIASRMVPGGRNEEDEHFIKPRKWGVKAAALLAALLWRREGPIMWDVLHGVKAFSVDAFRSLKPTRKGLSIDLEMVVRSYRLRLRRTEIPVCETGRFYGETHFKILPTAWKLWKYLMSEFHRPAPVRVLTSASTRGREITQENA